MTERSGVWAGGGKGNIGHGHVFPRPDGVKARCGGPGFCTECSKDAAVRAHEVAHSSCGQHCTSPNCNHVRVSGPGGESGSGE